MYIKKSQIIDFIKESVAESYFGKVFVEFKKRAQQGTNPLEVAEDLLQRIGQGSTRVVFSFPDNPGIVLKIINWDEEVGVNPRTGFERQQMIDSNKWESDLQMQQKYPNVFPRTFEHADDFSWIISEKVKPVSGFDELLKIMGLEDEQFSKFPSIRNIQFQALIELGISYFQEPSGAAQQMLSEVEQTVAMTQAPSTPRTSQGPQRAMGRRLQKLLATRQNTQILAAMGDLGIPSVEFSPKNVGVSEITGRLALLDASLWQEYKPVTESRKIKLSRKELRKIIREGIVPDKHSRAEA
jgi:hypothetical protein